MLPFGGRLGSPVLLLLAGHVPTLADALFVNFVEIIGDFGGRGGGSQTKGRGNAFQSQMREEQKNQEWRTVDTVEIPVDVPV